MQANRLKLFYFLGISFILLNAVLVTKGHYWFVAMPVGFALLLILFFSIDKLLLFIAFITPFSFNLKFSDLGFNIGIPNEPLLVAAMMMFFLRFALYPDYNKKFLKHPISVVVLLQLVWMLFTSITSEMPLVSFKYFFSHAWFVIPVFFLGLYLFFDSKNFNRFFWLFGVSLLAVIVLATIKHAGFGFQRKAIASAVAPFFNDHTHYAATIALVAPVILVLALIIKHRFLSKLLSPVLLFMFVAGVLFSYSRAAWMSVLVATLALVVLAFKIKPRYIVAGLLVIASLVAINQEKIFMRLETHTQASSEEMAEHFISAANITTDASNVERINRWVSAFRMFKERPIVGWGPGTYQFVYAPFQLSEYFNVVTTNVGDVGNAHSEYIGPLSEGGLLAMVLMLLLVFFALRSGIKLWRKGNTRNTRMIALGITLGFITYFSHGFLNNFLDTDKVAIPFWAMMAMLVSLELKNENETQHAK